MKQPPNPALGAGSRLAKLATQPTLPLIVTRPSEQSPSPLQPAKIDPLDATADNSTTVPTSNDAWQAVPQAIPAGTEVTVPMPVPARAIDSANAPPMALAVPDVAFAV